MHAARDEHQRSEKPTPDSDADHALLDLTAVFENSFIGICFMQNRVIRRCNQRLADIFRTASPQDLVGKTSELLFPDLDSYERMDREVGAMVASGKPFLSDWLMRRLDGQPVWCRLYAKAVDPLRPQRGIAWVVEDITEARQAEEALRRSKAVLDDTLEYMDQGITIVDDKLVAQVVNRRFCELYGFPPEMFRPGVPFADFVRNAAERGDYGPGDVEEQVRTRVALASRFEAHHFERERADGTVVEVRGLPIPGDRGFVTIYTDTTKRKSIGATFIPYYGGASWYNLTRQFDFGMARVGSVILALAVVASVRLWRRREVRFFIALAVIALLAAWSALPLLRTIPLFAVAKNERLGFAAAFALSILAAMAFDAMSRKVVLAVGAALMMATALLWPTRLGFGLQPKLMLIGAAAELLGIIALLRPRLAVALILGAIAVQRVAEDGFIYPALPRRLFYPEVPLIKAIPRDPLYRVAGTANLFIPNAASMYGLEDVRGYASLTYAPYRKTMALWCPNAQRSYNDVTDLTLPFLSFLGVRHAVTPRAMEPPPGWRVVTDDRNTRLMENERAIPRVFAPPTIRFMNNDDIALEEMRHATDFAAKAWIHSDDVPPQDVANGSAELRTTRVGSRYEIDVVARSGSHIVIADVAWPGWRAYLDGQRVRIDSANLAFLSLYVPEGRHHLRVEYLPDAFVRGRAISFGTILLWAIVFIRKRVRS